MGLSRRLPVLCWSWLKRHSPDVVDGTWVSFTVGRGFRCLARDPTLMNGVPWFSIVSVPTMYGILIVVYVFLLLSMYSYCSSMHSYHFLCILIVVYVFLFFVHVFLSLSMYSYSCLCILIVVCVFLDAATLTEVFPCIFLGCKANARVYLAKTGHGLHSSKIVVLLCVLWFCIVLCIVCV